ncbi:hypothetical protein CSC82_09185 [Rhodobacteraceae bacterium 4F10]|nr:hypothetical protein CSC82_09185 [Rhodobacteraceae bacterium 4F10]
MSKFFFLLVIQLSLFASPLGVVLAGSLLIVDEIPVEETDPQAEYEEDEEEAVEEGIPEADPGYTVTVFHKVPKGAYAGVARLLYKKQSNKGEFVCTATLIEPQILLTAQHCVRNKEGKLHKYIKVKFPKTYASRMHYQEVKLTSFNTALHKDGLKKGGNGKIKWSQTSDLALVRLNEPVPDAKDRLTPLLQESQIKTNSMKIFVGYGMQYINYQTEKIGGKRVFASITSDEVAMKIVGGNYRKKSFRVAGQVEVNGEILSVALCNGDSGGPFLLANPASPSSSLVVAGVNHAVLNGYSPEACAKPGNVSHIVGILGNMDFINAGIKKLQD